MIKSGISFNQQLIIYNDSANEATKSAALIAMETSLATLKKTDPEKYLEFKRAYDLHTKKGDGDMSFALQNDVNTEALFEMDIVKVNPQYNMSDVVVNKKLFLKIYILYFRV